MFALVITALLSFLSPFPVLAGSNLIVSSDASYSSSTTNFAAGQNLYVKLETDALVDGIHQLNLRDSTYNLIQTYNLSKNGNSFSTSLAAPSSEGYYSLEAVIESAGTSVKSVKTIKVGSPQNANIKVNVKSSQSTSSNTNMDSNSESPGTQNEGRESESPPQPSQTPASPEPQEAENGSLAGAVFSIVKVVFNFLWPF